MKQEYKYITPPWEIMEGACKMSPSVMADKNIFPIMGIAGWGTGWQAIQLAKPRFVPQYQQGDDPEIFFNNKTIEVLKLGRIVGTKGIPTKTISEPLI